MRAKSFHRNGDDIYQASYNEKATENTGYAVEATASQHSRRIDGSLTSTTSSAQWTGGCLGNDQGSRSVHLSASGALAAGGGTPATSSRLIGDILGIVKVPGVAGLRLDTPGCAVATDHRGIAVILSLRPCTTS